MTGGNEIKDVNDKKAWFGTKPSVLLSEVESPAGSKGVNELDPLPVPHELDGGPAAGELEGGKRAHR
jgi:hypothetical protein